MPTIGWTEECPKCGIRLLEMESRYLDERGECLACGYFVESAWDYYRDRSVEREGIIHKDSENRNNWAVVNHWFDSPARINFGWVNFTKNNLMKVPEKLRLTNPLHQAVKNGKYREVKTILENDPSFSRHFPGDMALSLDDGFGFTLLHAAALSGNVQMADLVLEFGTRKNGVDKDGVTALHLAAELNHVELTSWLLNRNVKVNMQDRDGDTPLHYAALQDSVSFALGSSHRKIMEMLISHGADPEIRNQNGQTALDILSEAEEKFKNL